MGLFSAQRGLVWGRHMSLDHLDFDPSAALQRTAELLETVRHNSEEHQARAPEFPATAAGKTLADRGAALSEAFLRLHAHTHEAIDAVRVSTLTARHHIHELDSGDHEHALTVGALDGGDHR